MDKCETTLGGAAVAMRGRRRSKLVRDEPSVLDSLYPNSGRVLLSGTGRQFVERLGIEATRQAIHNVMMGENLRTQTEPLSRRRIALISGAVITLFARGLLTRPGFIRELSALAVQQIEASPRADNERVWPAQWMIGLTGKSFQNVLRSDPEARARYVADFEAAIQESAATLESEFGELRLSLGYIRGDDGRRAELDWVGITRLTTAIGSQTLTIRGSDKSLYGKLFERLVLGSLLSILGYRRSVSGRPDSDHTFWLSDSSDIRESDATLLVKPGQLARFDIGFIGPGNSEISKDKLSRYAREHEINRMGHGSKTFVIVDRLPRTGKTEQAAAAIGAEIVQMSMAFWPRDVAMRLHQAYGTSHEIESIADADMSDYLMRALRNVPIEELVSGISFSGVSDAPAEDV